MAKIVDENLINQRFGRLIITSIDGRVNSRLFVNCTCDCGNTKRIRYDILKSGDSKSCGCLNIEVRHTSFITKPLEGLQFTNLTVIERVENRNKKVMYKCLCSCGNYMITDMSHLTSGHTKSCGCLTLLHGMSQTYIFRIWSSMVQRCTTTTHKQYDYYGGRGITVCNEWINDFNKFYEDMGDRPTEQHSLDRENNELGYSKANCRWATRKEQQNNIRSNVLLTCNNETLTLAQWSEKTGINYHTIRNRIERGWSIERTLTEEVQESKTIFLIERI